MLVKNRPGNDTGLIAIAGVNEITRTAYAHQYIVALWDRGFWDARRQDRAGILFTYVGISNRLADVESTQQIWDCLCQTTPAEFSRTTCSSR